MLDDLEPTVRTAIMKILSAIYESGFQDEVAMSIVMQLFGVPVADAGTDLIVSFNDTEFMRAYLTHKESEDALLTGLTDAVFDPFDLDDEVFDVEMVDMQTGETAHVTMTRDELNEAADEGADKIPDKPIRILH